MAESGGGMYSGGPINEAQTGLASIFGTGTGFGLNSSGWTIATGGSKATGSIAGMNPWLVGAGVLIVGVVLWKSLRK